MYTCTALDTRLMSIRVIATRCVVSLDTLSREAIYYIVTRECDVAFDLCCMYVCMYVRMYVCMYMYVYIYVCMWIYLMTNELIFDRAYWS